MDKPASPVDYDFYKSIFSYTTKNAVLILNTDGIIADINPAFTLSFGYKPEDVRGKNFAMLFTPEDVQKRKPEIELRNVKQNKHADDNNYLVNKEGKYIWVSGESVLAEGKDGKGCIVKLIQNIHAQKEFEKTLRDLHNANENILRSIEDLVIVVNENMNVVKANRAFYDLFKIEEPVGPATLHFAYIIQQYDIDNILVNKIQHALSTKICFHNQQIEIGTGKANKVFDFNCSLMQHGSEGQLLLIAHDVTTQKQIEKNREDVIGFVAHELKNPLATLILYNEMISEATRNNNAEEATQFIIKSNNNILRLNKIIGELYETSIFDSGNLSLEVSSFSVAEMIDEAIDTIKVRQPAKNILITGDAAIIIQGDRYKLIQVITNYLDNAIKYAADNTSILISVQQEKNMLTVGVKDSGSGIAKEQLAFVFDRFFRASTTKGVKGIGLGLYISKQIIQAHKGTVWVESEEGKGSEFFFSIPLHAILQ